MHGFTEVLAQNEIVALISVVMVLLIYRTWQIGDDTALQNMHAPKLCALTANPPPIIVKTTAVTNMILLFFIIIVAFKS